MVNDLSRLVTTRLAAAMAVPTDSLTPDTELDDEILEEVGGGFCEELGLDPAVLFPPDPQPPRNEFAVGGLRRLAPFSERAAAHLRGMERRFDFATVGSLTRSLEERRHVASGRVEVLKDLPLPPGRAAARFGAWMAGIATALSLGLWSDCNPACRACPSLPDVAANLGLPIALALVGGWHLFMLGAALRELGRAVGAEARA